MFILICLNVDAERANDLFGRTACIGFVWGHGKGKGVGMGMAGTCGVSVYLY